MKPDLLLPFRRPLTTVGILMAATIGAAFAIEAAGYPPCELCLAQRVPYYAGAGFLLAVAVAKRRGLRREAVSGLIALLITDLVISVCLGIFHTGVEQAWWNGPQSCSARMDATDIQSLVSSLQHIKTVSCTQANFWVFGLSLSVWNAVVSAAMATLVGTALVKTSSL